MITSKLGIKAITEGSIKFFSMLMGKKLFSLHIEVTKKCNARCNFCDYWKNKGNEKRLDDYSLIVKKFDPLHITITGGEPLLRRDLENIIHGITSKNRFVYINCITNGILLNEDRAKRLWNAGLTQLSISLDFPDSRHEAMRNVTGLWKHIRGLIKTLPLTEIDNLCFNTIIMKDNIDYLRDIIMLAHDYGWKVSFSTYNPFKNKNFSHKLDLNLIHRLEDAIAEIIYLKRKFRNITNSDYYLLKIPEYIKLGGIQGCTAGIKWAHITPNGFVRRCSEKEILGHWTEYDHRKTLPTKCTECWYACRGESEAPLDLKRIIELNR